MAEPEQNPVRRIGVVLTSAESNKPLLEMLALLAAEMPSEVLGLFVEDRELMRAAGLPFVRELCSLTLTERSLDVVEIRHHLKVQAQAAERALAQIAGQARVFHSFRYVRGAGAVLLQEAAREVDLTLMGPAHPTFRSLSDLELASHARASRRPIVVGYDASEVAARALGAAVRLAGEASCPLTVVVAVAVRHEIERLRREASELLTTGPADFQVQSKPGVEGLLEKARLQRASALVMGLTDELLNIKVMRMLREKLDRPALLVR